MSENLEFTFKVKFREHDLSSGFRSTPALINPKEIEDRVKAAIQKETLESIRATIVKAQSISDTEVDFFIRLTGLLGNETVDEFKDTKHWIKERIIDEWHWEAIFEVNEI